MMQIKPLAQHSAHSKAQCVSAVTFIPNASTSPHYHFPLSPPLHWPRYEVLRLTSSKGAAVVKFACLQGQDSAGSFFLTKNIGL